MDKKPSVKGSREDPRTELDEFKKFLGPLATPYSDAQLRELRREMYAMAELLLDIYLHNKRQRTVHQNAQENFDMSYPRP